MDGEEKTTVTGNFSYFNGNGANRRAAARRDESSDSYAENYSSEGDHLCQETEMNANKITRHESNVQWQTTKRNVRERNEFMFDNELLSDVKFMIQKEEGDYRLIPAHRYVLATCSPVFYAMLFGDLSMSDKPIEINDCEPECFLELLRFIYYDQINLTESNVLGTLYLAKKYIIPVLAKECISFLMDKVTSDNVLEVLQAAICCGETRLERHCWALLARETSDILESDSFSEIGKDLLIAILGKQRMSTSEVNVFKAVRKWASKECIRQDMEDNVESLQILLGDILKLIRFPIMSPREFAEGPARSGLLPIEDVRDIFVYLNSGIIENLKYSLTPRTFKPFTCFRYSRTMRNYLWRYDEKDIDGIRFKVSEHAYMCGIGLYGSPCGGEYNVHLSITDYNDFVYKKDTLFTCPPDPNLSSIDSPQIYQILFDEPLSLKENTFYNLGVVLDGPPSFAGDEGCAEVLCEGVKFTFENSGESMNGTSFDEGQIPTILFDF